MHRFLSLLTLLCCCIVVAACSSAPDKSASPQQQESEASGSAFVTVDGDRLVRRGKTYRFAGTNFWYGAYLGATDEGRVRLRRELDQLKAAGIIP